MKVKQKPGDYYFTSTRNNNFSNRSPKWHLTISRALQSSAHPINVVVPAVVGTIVGIGLVAAGIFLYTKYQAGEDDETAEGLSKHQKTKYQSLDNPADSPAVPPRGRV